MKNIKSHTALSAETEPETNISPNGSIEQASTGAPNGVTPFVVGGNDGKNWGIKGKYSALGTVNVSDTWSSPLINSGRNVLIKKRYTQAKTVPDSTGYNASVTYYDTVGAMEQNIAVKATPTGKDLVTPCDQAVLQAGETRLYLPYPAAASGSGAFRSGALSEQESYYATKLSTSDPKAYVRQKYEVSTRGRLTESTQPGLEIAKSKVYDVKIATEADQVLEIVYNTATGKLYVETAYLGTTQYPVILKKSMEDEDGRHIEVFENEHGHKILTRQSDGGINCDTYYVYDDLGNLVHIISPEGSSRLEKDKSYAMESPLVTEYCFTYVYDSRGRNIAKRVPGKGWEYCVYDRDGRIILLQDANMRSAGEEEGVHYWIKYDYDRFGRMVSQTMIRPPVTRTREELQALADEGKPIVMPLKAVLAEYRYDSPFEYEYRDLTVKADRWLLVYDLAADTKWPSVAPADSSKVFFDKDQSIKREFLIGSLLTPYGRPYLAYYIPTDYASLATALVAASDKCALSDTPPWRPLLSRVKTLVKTPFSFEPVEGICTTADKDYRTRGLKTQEAVAILSDGMAATGKFVTRLFYYDSRGRVIQIAERNAQGGVSRYSMKYDFNGRVIIVQETHQRTAGKPDSDTKRTQYTYDTRGRLLSQTITLNQAQAAVSYAYDELGKLSSKTTTATGNATPLTIGYEYDIRGQLTAINSPGAYSQKNEYSPAGNITRMIVNAPLFKLTGITYTHKYDGMNRLRRATRSQASKVVTYNMDYDLNGNVTSFVRDKRNPQKSIAQYYTYEGNQLREMQRTATDTADGPGTYYFGYDGNGNMIGKRMENNRNPINFQYNYLNLTDVISTPQGPLLYTWLADGTKAQTRKINGGQESGTVYLGSLMYDYTKTTLSVETLFDGGMIGDGQGGEYSTLYIADHLGSVRVTVSGQPMLFNEYEPFGLLEKEYSVNLVPQMPPELNDRLFNGKQELFPAGESLLDFGARLYDPTVARWNSVDPMAHDYSTISPYAYCANNPLRFTDPTGMIIDPASRKEWDRMGRKIQNQLNDALNFREAYLNAAGSNLDGSALARIDAKIELLRLSLFYMDELEASEQVYALNYVPGIEGKLTYDPATDIITLNYGSDALFVHELTHAWQFENQKFGYNKNNGKSRGVDIYDEAEAFASQWAFNPESVNGLNPTQPIVSIDDITPEWVTGIMDVNGNFPYGPEGEFIVGQKDITVSSFGIKVQKAYFWVNKKEFAGWRWKSMKAKYKDNLYYKK